MRTPVIKRHVSLILVTLVLTFGFQNCDKSVSFSYTPTTDNSSLSTTAEAQYTEHDMFFSVDQASNKVDVLVVIDNSGSMGYEQQSMSQRFSSFLDQLNGLDWQVGIITTDVSNSSSSTSDGKLLEFNNSGKYLIKSSEDLNISKNLFAATIQRPEQGSGNEQGLKASIRALQRAASSSNINSQLIRSGAALSVIVITDANETGSTTSDALLDHVTSNFSGKSFKFHSIIVKNEDQSCLSDRTAYTTASGSNKTNTNESYGTKYQALSTKTSGLVGSVCSADYGSQLQNIGQSTAQQIREITLDCAAVDREGDGNVDIEIRDATSGSLISNYTINGLQVRFDQALTAGNYSVRYTCQH